MIELSIIIPTHNRAGRLRTCLEALSRQTQLATDFEVLVVNDGSTDGTAEMLAQIATPFPLRVINQAKSGQCMARNRGIAAASRYCLFLDDDVLAGPALVVEHLNAQRTIGSVVAIGQLTTLPPAAADWYACHFAKRWSDHYAHLNQGVRALTWQDCYSGNMSVPRQTLLDVGGFDVDLPAGFDVELGYRLQQRGVPLVYLSAACGEHHDDKTGRRLLSDDERAGRMLLELTHRHPELLPELLGEFWRTSPRVIRLRRLLLSLGIAPYLLTHLSPFLLSEYWNQEWFRFVSAYAYWCGVRRALPQRDTWQQIMYRTPILMYHAFGGPGEKPSRYVIPIRRFAQQMAWLKRMRYRVLSLEEYLRYLCDHRLPPTRSVVITIDDGYADILTLAYPILQRHQFPATIFAVSGRVGSTNQWDRNNVLTGRRLLAWSDIKEMARDGIQIGAHTRTHPHLRTLSQEQVRTEVLGSLADLEQELKVPIQTFAYPYGEYDTTVQDVVEQAGFLGSCGVKEGLNVCARPPYALRRIEIQGTDSLLDFVLKLRGGKGFSSHERDNTA